MTEPTDTTSPTSPASAASPTTFGAARRLDESIAVSRPVAWLALIGVSALIAIAVIVALVVHVPKVATASATVVFSGGTMAATSPMSGSVQEVKLVVGALVKKGDALMTVRGLDGTAQTVLAPDNGTVLSIPVNVGEVVAAGETVAEMSRWSSETSVSAIAFVSSDEAANFPVGSTVQVFLGNIVRTGTVARVSVVRFPLEAVAEVVGDESLAQTVYQRTNGSPLAVTISVDLGDQTQSADVPAGVTVPSGAAVGVRRVVSDPTLWSMVFGGGG